MTTTHLGAVAALHRYTGISEAYIRSADLRIDGSRFLAEFRRNQGKTQHEKKLKWTENGDL